MIRTNTNLLKEIGRLSTAARFRDQIRTVKLKAGKRLIWQDDAPTHVYCIIQGMAKCFITEENGQDFLLEFFGEGEIIGELELLTQKGYLCNIEAMTDIRLYKIANSVFMSILEEDPAFNKLILVELANRLSRTARRASYQQVFPLEYAVLKIIYVFYENQQPIAKKDMADYLAVSIRSLNRVLKQLREKGILGAGEQELAVESRQKLLDAMQTFY